MRSISTTLPPLTLFITHRPHLLLLTCVSVTHLQPGSYLQPLQELASLCLCTLSHYNGFSWSRGGGGERGATCRVIDYSVPGQDIIKLGKQKKQWSNIGNCRIIHTGCSLNIVFFTLKFCDFRNSCQFCCSAGVLPAI